MSSSRLLFSINLLAFCMITGCAEIPVDRITQSKGFIDRTPEGLKVLHLRGTAYERGYQRGTLQDDLEMVTLYNITELAAWFGGDDLEAGLIALRKARETMEAFIPYQFRQEMKGMADALAERGSNVTYDDIVLHLVGADFGMMNPDGDLVRSPKRTPFPPLSRCSSFAVWGEATSDGELIMAANADYYDTEEELKNRPIAVVDPTDGGYGYVGALWDVFFVATGMNEAGIAINGHLSYADSESLQGVAAELLLAMVLQYADSIEDAVEILTAYPRTCGIIINVADAKTGEAAIIEYTADDIAVRYAENGKDAVWTTNHFNAYPGWQGYTGFNMAPTQKERGWLTDISSIDAWQDSLEKNGVGRAGRYGRYQQLLEENHGRITVDKAREIISDRYSVRQNKKLDTAEATSGNDYPIMVCRNDWVMSEKIDYYKSDRSGELRVKSGNVSSFVGLPSTGDMWWSVGLPPSAYTAGYVHINLHEELAKNR